MGVGSDVQASGEGSGQRVRGGCAGVGEPGEGGGDVQAGGKGGARGGEEQVGRRAGKGGPGGVVSPPARAPMKNLKTLDDCGSVQTWQAGACRWWERKLLQAERCVEQAWSATRCSVPRQTCTENRKRGRGDDLWAAARERR
jgi:hypothetical protein